MPSRLSAPPSHTASARAALFVFTPLVAILACVAASARPEPIPTFDQMVVRNVRDLQASVSVVKADQAELRKITPDLAMFFTLRNITLSYKDPNKLRAQNSTGLFILNGSMRFIHVPKLGLRRKDDLGASLSRRYSLFDLGLLTPSSLAALTGKYVRTESIDGRQAALFEVRFRDGSADKYLAWIDQERKVVLRREWHDGAGKLKATTHFHDVRQVAPSVWLPTRVEVMNADGVEAGVSAYSAIKLNEDLPDSLFEPVERGAKP